MQGRGFQMALQHLGSFLGKVVAGLVQSSYVNGDICWEIAIAADGPRSFVEPWRSPGSECLFCGCTLILDFHVARGRSSNYQKSQLSLLTMWSW